jgi:alcohol dehydrogenase
MARALGANVALNPASLADTALAVRDVTGGGAHVSIDGLGITSTIHNSVRSLRKLGRHVQIGQPLGPHANPTMPLLETVYARQISILGTRGIAAARFSALLGMIAAGRLDPARMITKRIALSEAGTALQAMDGYTGVGVTVIDRLQA